MGKTFKDTNKYKSLKGKKNEHGEDQYDVTKKQLKKKAKKKYIENEKDNFINLNLENNDEND